MKRKSIGRQGRIDQRVGSKRIAFLRIALPVLFILILALMIARTLGPRLAHASDRSAPTRQTSVGGAQSASLPIEHVIFIVKENRTFDNYFGRFPGADGAT